MKNITKKRCTHLADLEKDCESIGAGSDEIFVDYMKERMKPRSPSAFATWIKETANIRYKDKMTKAELKAAGIAYEETEWNKLCSSILHLASLGIGKLIIVNPDEKMLKRVKDSGFKVEVEKYKDEQISGKTIARVGRITITW